MNIDILFASRLVHEKWVDILIECIEKYHNDDNLSGNISWHICSDGYEQWHIEKLAEKYEHVHYYGKISSIEIKKLYENADVLFMPSRFLETFWLTALEALSLGTPVCAPQKGGLRSFVPDTLALDETDPVESFRKILLRFWVSKNFPLSDISTFSKRWWHQKLEAILWKNTKILILHDYSERIWWAEYYIEFLTQSIEATGRSVRFFGYEWYTTPWKRRLMFIFSIFAFWRGVTLYRHIQEYKPDTVWMHSIMRYIGPWWVLAVRLSSKSLAQIFLSHHDVGLIAAFPQDITKENQIPHVPTLRGFIPMDTSVRQRVSSIWKWCYIQFIKYLLPKNTIHIIFADFMYQPIRAHFWKETEIILFPHASIYETSSSEGV